MQVVSVDDRTFELDLKRDALRTLCRNFANCALPLVVEAPVGPSRVSKSTWLLLRQRCDLGDAWADGAGLRRGDVFRAAPTTAPVTSGIWVWPWPVPRRGGGSTLFVDFEGSDAGSDAATAKIAAVAACVADVLVLLSRGAPTNVELRQLGAMAAARGTHRAAALAAAHGAGGNGSAEAAVAARCGAPQELLIVSMCMSDAEAAASVAEAAVAAAVAVAGGAAGGSLPGVLAAANDGHDACRGAVRETWPGGALRWHCVAAPTNRELDALEQSDAVPVPPLPDAAGSVFGASLRAALSAAAAAAAGAAAPAAAAAAAGGAGMSAIDGFAATLERVVTTAGAAPTLDGWVAQQEAAVAAGLAAGRRGIDAAAGGAVAAAWQAALAAATDETTIPSVAVLGVPVFDAAAARRSVNRAVASVAAAAGAPRAACVAQTLTAAVAQAAAQAQAAAEAARQQRVAVIVQDRAARAVAAQQVALALQLAVNAVGDLALQMSVTWSQLVGVAYRHANDGHANYCRNYTGVFNGTAERAQAVVTAADAADVIGAFNRCLGGAQQMSNAHQDGGNNRQGQNGCATLRQQIGSLGALLNALVNAHAALAAAQQ
jgi:hypothetical protein